MRAGPFFLDLRVYQSVLCQIEEPRICVEQYVQVQLSWEMKVYHPRVLIISSVELTTNKPEIRGDKAVVGALRPVSSRVYNGVDVVHGSA